MSGLAPFLPLDPKDVSIYVDRRELDYILKNGAGVQRFDGLTADAVIALPLNVVPTQINVNGNLIKEVIILDADGAAYTALDTSTAAISVPSAGNQLVTVTIPALVAADGTLATLTWSFA